MIDKSKFIKQVQLEGIKILKSQTSQYVTILQPFILRNKTQKNVVNLTNTHNLILLNEKQDFQSLPENIQTQINKDKLEIVKFEFNLKYEDFTMQQILQQILPKKFSDSNMIPTSFETAGHIAHLNLSPCHEEFKHIIGQVLLDKNKGIKTVVNKVEALKDNIYRNPKLELLAGEDNYITNVNEDGTIFQIDYSKVYWNSRLNQERERILKKFKKDEVLCDMFCGVGPLAIRAAKLGMKVIANDLNPDCYEFLLKNIKLNKQQTMIQAYNMCARDFIALVVKQNTFQHIYMNLPGSAVEFLDIFQGFYQIADKELWKILPIIHIYTFISIDDEKDFQDVVFSKIQEVLRNFKQKDIIEIYNVRDVSASSRMYSISFRLSEEVASDKQFKKIKLQ